MVVEITVPDLIQIEAGYILREGDIASLYLKETLGVANITDECGKEAKKIFMKRLKDPNINMQSTKVEFRLKKVNGIWLIDVTVDDGKSLRDLGDAITGGMGIREVNKLFLCNPPDLIESVRD